MTMFWSLAWTIPNNEVNTSLILDIMYKMAKQMKTVKTHHQTDIFLPRAHINLHNMVGNTIRKKKRIIANKIHFMICPFE